MPRYVVETDRLAEAQLDAAVRLAARRFPEIVIEQQPVVLSAAGANGSRARWVCRAPSPLHLHRWADAAHISPTTVTHTDGERAARDDQGDQT